MIIATFLQSGDLIILCICLAITKEALQRIKHEAIFRVNFNIEGRGNTVLERAKILPGLQNVAIRFHLPPGRAAPSEDMFNSSSIRHLGYRDDGTMNRCTVTISYNGGHSFELLDERTKLKEIRPGGPQLPPMLLYALSGYTHFNTVVIMVVRGPRDEYWTSSIQRRLCIDISDAEVLKKRLAPALGPAEFINDSGNCHLGFSHASTRTAESIILSSSVQTRIDAGRGILVNSLKITAGGITLAVLPKRATSRAARAHQEQTERGVEAQRVLEIVGYGLPRKDKVEPRHAYFFQQAEKDS